MSMTPDMEIEFAELAILAKLLAQLTEKNRDWHVKELSRKITARAERLSVPTITLFEAFNGKLMRKQ